MYPDEKYCNVPEATQSIPSTLSEINGTANEIRELALSLKQNILGNVPVNPSEAPEPCECLTDALLLLKHKLYEIRGLLTDSAEAFNK